MSRTPADSKYRMRLLVLVSLGPFILALAFAWRFREDPQIAVAMAAAGLLFTVGAARTAWLGSWWTGRQWNAFAEEHGYEYVIMFDHEPQIRGERNGVKFRISVASPRITREGHYTRTYGTVAIPGQVPDGLRVYRRSSQMWVTDYSGLRAVETGIDALDTLFFVEGADADDVLDFVSDRHEALVGLGTAWPEAMVYGRDDDGPPIVVDEEATGAITIVESGRRSARKLDRMIDALCSTASALHRD